MQNATRQHPVAQAVFAKSKLDALAPILVKASFFPVKFWEVGCLFSGVEDRWWRIKTRDEFPHKLKQDKKTHPLYVLKSGSYGAEVCPCSTCRPFLLPRRSIPVGTRLLHTGYKTERTSYILWSIPVDLNAAERLEHTPGFMGLCPPENLHVEA